MPAVQPTTPALAETPMESHLRAIVEAQPVCLTRISAEGAFLAVNEAALSMLGAERLDQVLDRSFLDLVIAEHRAGCLAFIKHVVSGKRGSHEIELEGLHGQRHTLQIHAVTLGSHPDRLPSILCTFRDVTEHRRLERALLEASARPGALSPDPAGPRQVDAAAGTDTDGLAARLEAERLRSEVLEEELARGRRAVDAARLALGRSGELAAVLKQLIAVSGELAHQAEGTPLRTAVSSLQRLALQASHLLPADPHDPAAGAPPSR